MIPEALLSVDRGYYVLGEEFARGGLGRIFAATDRRTGRTVAIKQVMDPDEEALARFAREAFVSANLQHPSIIPVYEVGRFASDEPFFAMKLVRGRSLEDLIAQAPGTQERMTLVSHVIDVADALAYAHGERVIHRDLKPANVLVGAYGETVVIDWGLAKNLSTGDESRASHTAVANVAIARTARAGASDAETVAGSVMGTPAYMPPEQARGEAVDERADVYAIGAMLYHVLGGARPYADAEGTQTVLQRVMAGPPQPLVALAPTLPAELVAIVTRAMAAVANERYPTARELAADLRRFQAGQLVGAHRYTPWQIVARWLRRNRALVATAAVGLATLAMFAAYSVRRIAAERDEATHQRIEAVHSRAEAEMRLGEGLEELGRQALVGAEPGRAMAYLAGAWARRPEGTAVTRFLAGRSRQTWRALTDVAPAHAGGTNFAALTPDGSMLVSAGADNTVRGWNVREQRLAWNQFGPSYCALSPDGRLVVGTQDDGTVTVFSSADGSVRSRGVLAAREGALAIGWSPDGTRFAVGGLRGTMGVWGAAPPWPMHTHVGGHTLQVREVKFSPDGQSFATASDDGAVVVWDATTVTPRVRMEAHPGGASTLAWMGNDRLVSGGADERVDVWDATTGERVRQLVAKASIYHVAVNGAGTRIAASLVSSEALVWDVRTGEKIATLPGHYDGVNEVAWVGDEALTADEGGTLRLWDVGRREVVREIPSEGVAYSLQFTAGRLVVAGRSPRIRVLRTDVPLARTRLVGHVGRLRAVTFDRAGTTVYTASNDGTARAWDLVTGALRFSVGANVPAVEPPPAAPGEIPLADPHGLRALALSPDGRTLVTAAEDGVVGVWDAHTGASHGRLVGHVGRVRDVTFSRDGATVLTAGQDATARMWDVATAHERLRVTTHGPAQTARWIEEANRLMVVDEDSTVSLWDATTGARVDRGGLQPHKRMDLVVIPGGRVVTVQPDAVRLMDARTGMVTGQISAPIAFDVDLAPDGRTLAIGTAGGEVMLADTVTGNVIRSWHAVHGVVAAVRYRPDGALLASLGQDTIARVWEAATGRLLWASQPFPGVTLLLQWSPDGRRLVVGGMPTEAWVWDLTPDEGPLEAFTHRAACTSPWTLEGTALTIAPANPRECRNDATINGAFEP